MSELNEEKLNSSENEDPINADDVKGSDKVSIPAEPKKSPFLIGLIDQLEVIVIAFAAIILIFSFVTRTCEVKGASMEDTLINGENVLISDVFYTPKRGDIIVFHQTGDKYNEPIVKRVIGLPGDTVKIRYTSGMMKVTVTDAQGNSEVLDEPYIKESGFSYYTDSETFVEDGTLFVMGDNRSISADSRSEDIGLVDQRRILGRVILRLTPISKIGKVE